MTKILVVYASDYGATRAMAEAVAEGAASVEGVTSLLKDAEAVAAEDMTLSDGIVFGSPVHMGSMDWRVKKVIDAVCSKLWMQDALNGKAGGVFVTGGGFGGAGGGVEVTMLSMLANLAELGLLLVTLPKNTPGYQHGGLHWGPYARTADAGGNPVGVQPEALAVARCHGANVARAARALSRQAAD